MKHRSDLSRRPPRLIFVDLLHPSADADRKPPPIQQAATMYLRQERSKETNYVHLCFCDEKKDGKKVEKKDEKKDVVCSLPSTTYQRCHVWYVLGEDHYSHCNNL
nr:heavy metal-associated isoprenylated plant protein 26-like [Ipomoea batatas]